MQRKIILKEIKGEILSKVRFGEKVVLTADQYGVNTKSIYTWLSKEAGQETISPLKHNKN